MKDITRTDILNALIRKYRLTSYLEIGVQNKDNNFNKILCPVKYGVDPDVNAKADFIGTSDDFFYQNKRTFDLIFIDGLHHYEQVKRDFENALICLRDDGYILIHDSLPENEIGTRVPRETLVWWGDVYKFIFQLWAYQNINFKIFNTDQGCCLIWKEIMAPRKADNMFYNGKRWDKINFTWQFYLDNKHLLKITDEFII